MSDKTPTDDLPELSDAAVERIEAAVFGEIADERPRRAAAAAPGRIRRRRWLTGAGIAAAFVVGVLVTPPILDSVGGMSASTADGGSIPADGGSLPADGGSLPSDGAIEDSAVSPDRSLPGAVGDQAPSTSAESGAVAPGAVTSPDREIIMTSSATAEIEVDDIREAADTLAELADSRGGYVEGTSVGEARVVDGTSEPTPADSSYGSVSLRVPSDSLPEVMDELAQVGVVVSSSVSKQDVTLTVVDLRARVEATKASVQRLTELMAQSGSVSELIEAELALTDRQAQLESYQQQLTVVEDQVALSLVQVSLQEAPSPATAEPTGFADGLLAGWNGLVVSLNALVISIGFLLPWLAVAAVVVLIVWLVRRSRGGRTAVPAPEES